MSLKFSGYCYIKVSNREIVFDPEEECDYDVIYEKPWMKEDFWFESDILDQIKERDNIKDLENGLYYIYFNGLADFGSTYCYDYGCYEGYAEWNIGEVSCEKLDELSGIKDINEFEEKPTTRN